MFISDFDLLICRSFWVWIRCLSGVSCIIYWTLYRCLIFQKAKRESLARGKWWHQFCVFLVLRQIIVFFIIYFILNSYLKRLQAVFIALPLKDIPLAYFLVIFHWNILLTLNILSKWVVGLGDLRILCSGLFCLLCALAKGRRCDVILQGVGFASLSSSPNSDVWLWAPKESNAQHPFFPSCFRDFSAEGWENRKRSDLCILSLFGVLSILRNEVLCLQQLPPAGDTPRAPHCHSRERSHSHPWELCSCSMRGKRFDKSKSNLSKTPPEVTSTLWRASETSPVVLFPAVSRELGSAGHANPLTPVSIRCDEFKLMFRRLRAGPRVILPRKSHLRWTGLKLEQ